MRTIVYVDGYNLYYGLLKSSPHKWLDLFKLFNEHVLDENAELLEIRYYTAPVLSKMSDSQESSNRQRQYLQALRKMPPYKVQIIEGRIQQATPYLRLVRPIEEAPELKKVQVYEFNEKKTDVNLASDMISGAWTGAYEQLILCSNDSDHEGALATIRKHHLGIRIGLVAPIQGSDSRKISHDLTALAHWGKILSTVHLANAQLPEKIPHTSIHKPTSW
ncbi:MAG: NYN domain-containing protein [Gallionella sp.]